jgi:3-oxoacyl-[acyl-carrier protein] reductase
MLLQDRVAVVTGATRGIGKSILYRLAEEGAKVIGVYANSDQAAREIEEDIWGKGGQVQFYKGSVTDRAFVGEMFQEIKEKQGSLDVLVNNAGIVRDQLLFQMPDEDWEAVYRTNFLGTYICSTEVLPYMKEQQAGKVVNVVSVTGVIGREAQTNYGASKGSIMGLTRLLARKYATRGIAFNAVAPGMINTEMIGHVPKEKLDNFLRYTNVNRLGEPEEVAQAVLYLASDLSGYVTDTVLRVDGGFLR